MSYPRQDSTAKRLTADSLRAIDGVQEKGWSEIHREWNKTRMDLRNFIRGVYRYHIPEGNWDLAKARASGAFFSLRSGLEERLNQFRDASRTAAKQNLNAVYRESLLRQAWVLDQITPPSRAVRIPHRLKLFEAQAITFYRGADARAAWNERWTSWTDAYRSSLMNNLQLGMINESSPDDAADEVDATKAGTPSYGLMDSLYRLYQSEAAYALARAANELAAVNGDMDVIEIWQTRDNMRVCDECYANNGLTAEESDGDIPLHPNCNCYWRLVPKSYADLLRSGDLDDYELSRLMDAKGVVPNSMTILDDNGELAGRLIVTFDEWQAQNFQAIGAGQ